MDLTSMNATRKSYNEESRLDNVEAPSIFFNSSIMSPGTKHSPLNKQFNRPSTILEVSESNRTGMSSYKTAMTGTATEASYRTADYTDFTLPKYEISVDSLDESSKPIIDLTKDSLDQSDSGLQISDSIDISNAHEDDDSEPEFNDTLERMDFMLSKAAAMQQKPVPAIQPVEEISKTPNNRMNLLDMSIPFVAAKLTPQPISAKKTMNRLTPKNSPLIHFSPVVSKNSPANRSPAAFKKPTGSSTKPPAPLIPSSKKYLHIQSPIASYIKQAPVAPPAIVAGKFIQGVTGTSKTPNFRDSEKFSKENESMNSQKNFPSCAKTNSATKLKVNLIRLLYFIKLY
jgi:hypothetical protein